LCATRIRYALAASGRDRAGKGVGYQGREHELARTRRGGCTAVDDLSLITVRSGDLVERAREGDARVVGDGSLQVGGRGGGYGDGHATRRRLAVLAVVEGDVTRIVIEGQRSHRPRPGAVHVVRYLHMPGGVVLGKPPDEEIPLGNRVGERDGERWDPRPGRGCRSLDERRAGDRRAGKENSEGGHHSQASSGQSRREISHSHFSASFFRMRCEKKGRWSLIGL